VIRALPPAHRRSTFGAARLRNTARKAIGGDQCCLWTGPVPIPIPRPLAEPGSL
jgi:hypothetical protein